MILLDLVTYLQTQGIGTVGTNLFYGMVPDGDQVADALVSLLEFPGRPSEPDMGTGNLRLVFPRVQAVIRGTRDDYDTPRQKAQDVVTALVKVVNQALNPSGASYKVIAPRSDPAFLMRDTNQRVYFKIDFDVTKTYTA